MKTFVIPPLNHLELSKKGTGGIFCLAHLYLQDPFYREFMLASQREGRFILLDNSAAEDALVSTETLLSIIDELQPNEVVAPDVLLNTEMTLQKMERFLEALDKKQGYKPKVLGCPQASHSSHWLHCYEVMLENESIDTIGLSKFSVTKCFVPWRGAIQNDHISDARQNCVNILSGYNKIRKPLHLLGMGSPLEYAFYSTLPQEHQKFLRSTDSCYSVLSAWKGIKWDFENTQPGNFHRIPTEESYFTATLNSEQYQWAESNIEFLNKIVATVC